MEPRNQFLDYCRETSAFLDTYEGVKKSRDPATLYHYTTADGLAGILKDKCLRASHIRYTNDDLEFRYGTKIWAECAKEMQGKAQEPRGPSIIADAMKECWPSNAGEASAVQQDARFDGVLRRLVGMAEHLEAESERYSGAFCASLTTHRDDLYQWQAYASAGKGFALGFDRRRLISVVGAQYVLKRVLYDKAENKRIVTSVLESFRRYLNSNTNVEAEDAEYDLLRVLLHTCLYFKNPSFAAEKEWRIAPARTLVECAGLDAPSVRIEDGALIPFIQVPFAPNEDDNVVPLKEIVIGYGRPYEKTKHALQHMLRRCGYQEDGRGYRKMPAIERSGVTLT